MSKKLPALKLRAACFYYCDQILAQNQWQNSSQGFWPILYTLFEVKHFFHHRESFSRLESRHGLKIFRHFLLPAQVNRFIC